MQAQTLKNRFVDKGYNVENINKVLGGHRQEQQGVSDKIGLSLVTVFSTQNVSVKKIIKKHWGVLKNDRVFGPQIF